jgi:hypothetical protein
MGGEWGKVGERSKNWTWEKRCGGVEGRGIRGVYHPKVDYENSRFRNHLNVLTFYQD